MKCGSARGSAGRVFLPPHIHDSSTDIPGYLSICWPPKASGLGSLQSSFLTQAFTEHLIVEPLEALF